MMAYRNERTDAWTSIVDLLVPAVDTSHPVPVDESMKQRSRRLPRISFWPFMNDARDTAPATHEIETERYYLLNGWGL